LGGASDRQVVYVDIVAICADSQETDPHVGGMIHAGEVHVVLVPAPLSIVTRDRRADVCPCSTSDGYLHLDPVVTGIITAVMEHPKRQHHAGLEREVQHRAFQPAAISHIGGVGVEISQPGAAGGWIAGGMDG